MLGAIDIGTNSVRLLIGEIRNGRVVPVYRTLNSTRLGEGVNQTGYLKPEAIKRTVEAVHEFMGIAKQYNISQYNIFATSAARDALNQEELRQALSMYGENMQIITGKEEAFLSYLGVVKAFPGFKYPVVVDIGGGSTEIIYQEEKDLKSTSTNVGAVRCTEAGFCREDIEKKLTPVLSPLISKKKLNLIAVGGTATSLVSIREALNPYDSEKVQGYELTLESVQSIFTKLMSLSLEERKKVIGLKPERADIMPKGIEILLVILEKLGINKLTVSESDILEGMLYSMDNRN